MRHRLVGPSWALAAVLMFVGSALAPLVLAPPASAQITDVSPQNEAVNAAIAQAKATLPQFFARLANPQPGDSGLLIKIRFDKRLGDGSGEHIWGKDIVSNGNTVTLTIDNDPRDVKYIKRGDRVTVPVADATDWLYERDGKYQGAYTVRALLPFMEPAAAARMRECLPD